LDRTLQVRWIDADPADRHACDTTVVTEVHVGAGYSNRR